MNPINIRIKLESFLEREWEEVTLYNPTLLMFIYLPYNLFFIIFKVINIYLVSLQIIYQVKMKFSLIIIRGFCYTIAECNRKVCLLMTDIIIEIGS